jgi:hypothetical protein
LGETIPREEESMGKKGRKAGAPEGARRATVGAPGGIEDRGRFSARRKMEAVLRLLRGEDLDHVSREIGVTAATLAQWREAFVVGGQASLKSRPEDDRDEEIRQLREKIGEITMDNELLLKRARAAEANLPLPWRRSR